MAGDISPVPMFQVHSIPHICHQHHRQCRCQALKPLRPPPPPSRPPLPLPPLKSYQNPQGGEGQPTRVSFFYWIWLVYLLQSIDITIYAVLSQNQLCRDLRSFGVKFLSWKWCRCQKNMRSETIQPSLMWLPALPFAAPHITICLFTNKFTMSDNCKSSSPSSWFQKRTLGLQ